ncbi:UNKNOWN [Stylonychia lemnae]|uniref:Methionine synthase reductase n=1 Tax=Stylonychia lemnae TaxID=5949 RepID=A0A078ALV6_STYLE|nr:UNKNOWN [Stylonychia lemnae]|eukprot:CDW81838.1 UNKNOWN [Stylonychia lemnae]
MESTYKSGQNPQIYILYASETGNCEQISQDFFETFSKDYPNAKRFVLNDHQTQKNGQSAFDLQSKDALKVCIFLTSSTGDGDSPDNGEIFHKFLRKQTNHLEEGQHSTALSHVFYTVLGLGDSNYSKFQGAPRFLDSKLKQLGAQTFYDRAEADEATSLELVVEPWLEGLNDSINSIIRKIKKFDQEYIDQLLTPIDVNEHQAQVDGHDDENESIKTPLMTYGNIIGGKITPCSPDRELLEIEFKTDKPVSRDLIDVGSAFSFLPQNSEETINYVIEKFKWDRNALIGNDTVYDLLQKSVDIVSEKLKLSKVLTDYDLQFLPEEAKESKHITLKDFSEYTVKFDQIPFSILEDDVPKIKERYYSIINDPFYDEKEKQVVETSHTFKICFGLHKFSVRGQNRFGLATSFMKDILVNQEFSRKIKMHFSHSNRIIYFPHKEYVQELKPLIFICHGTGITPFISILERIKNIYESHERFGDLIMLFGVRSDTENFLFREQLLDIFTKLKLKSDYSQLYLASSQSLSEETYNGLVIKRKGHVQSFFEDQSVRDRIKNYLLEKEGYLMICGNKSTLGQSVIKGLNEKFDELFSHSQLDKLKQSGNLLLELWDD